MILSQIFCKTAEFFCVKIVYLDPLILILKYFLKNVHFKCFGAILVQVFGNKSLLTLTLTEKAPMKM